ncbi:S9 family peptidase [Desertivibrio insolitus]|uniref:S9 family peptidase n=1 Tax=Herbiconiux sp. SYSU D00978 TaxID=2812562 RepID=UPI001A9632F0|nr:S9 family peptidase [Herbiconiux sp. SYSU D00978]
MPTTPEPRRKPITRRHHGHEFIDDYEWLRAKDDPEVIAYLEAENAWTKEQTQHLEPLQERIFEEIKSRTLETDLSVPVRQGDWWYYTRTEEGKSYGISCRVRAAGPDDWTPPVLEPGTVLEGEQVLLDSNVEAEGHEFFSLGSFDVSPDGVRLAYGVDTTGDERYVLRIRDLTTGENLPDEIPNTFPGATFSPDGRYVFYPTVDDAWRPDTIWRHEVGTPASADVRVFTESDERFWTSVGVTRSERFLVIAVGSKITSEYRVLDSADPTGEFRIVWPRREGVEYSLDHAVVDGEDRFLVLHNDGAENFELVSVAAADPEGERVVVLPHDPQVRLEDVSAFAGHVVLDYRQGGLARVGVLPADELKARARVTEVDFGETLFTASAGGNPEWTQPTVRVGFSSLVTPSTVYDYDVRSGELTLLKRQPVLGGYDPGDYVQMRQWAVADDGVRVPISLVWKRGIDETMPAPTLLYGYGSYETSIDPTFSIPRLSLLDRGVVFAIAHVRGGGELGRSWYENGKTLTKRNTFTDFIACARHLIRAGVTSPELLVAEGRSAGGLLMGAVANLAPELFAGILAGVPFVDALTSILDPSLPLTVIEWDEWGDPLHDPAVYEYMRSYTPYENVRSDVAYPKILAVTSLNDTRVLYVEPAKWTARLREVGAPVLLKTEMSAGHGGVSGRYDAWRERAFEYAWVVETAGAEASVPALTPAPGA